MTTSTEQQLVDRVWGGFAVPPRPYMDEWAAKHIVLSTLTSAVEGPFDPLRFPFCVEIMRQLSPHSPTQRIVWMGGRQLAKTTIVRVLIAYTIAVCPRSMIVVQPSLPLLKKFRRLHVKPVLEETKVLQGLVSKSKAKSADNTMFQVVFRGGVLSMANAHSSAALRGGSAGTILCEELNEWPRDVDGQGDPLGIVEECAATYPDRKVFMDGNPGIKGASKIETQFLAGDQRRFFIPCPHCGFMAILTWDGRPWYSAKLIDDPITCHRISWDKTPEGKHLPRTAHMVCGNQAKDEDGALVCGRRVGHDFKTWMLERGEWRATAEGDGETVSYQISSLYSPVGFRSWAECAIRFLRAKKDPDGLRSWVNNTLGETWEGDTEQIGAEGVFGRREAYAAPVPEGVGVLTAGVDTQGDRLVYVVMGWGLGEERWVIEWEELQGDPARNDVWLQLDTRLLAAQFRHQGGRLLRVERVCVDSGGKKGHTDRVYQYCSARNPRVFAVKGGKEKGKPLVGMPSIRNTYRTPLFVLCVDSGKIEHVKRLAQIERGPGFVHIPKTDDPDRDLEFVNQITAEKALYKRDGRVWDKVFPRNHALDCMVYARAALHILRLPPDQLAAKVLEASSPPPKTQRPEPTVPAVFTRRPGRWIRPGFKV